MRLPARRSLLAALAAATLAAAGCDDDDDGGAGASSTGDAPVVTSSIGMKDLKFDPARAQVKVGEEVTWTNEESIPHDVVADSGADFTSDAFGKDGTFSFTPTTAGTITYECTLHPGMTGTLEVVEG